MNRAAKPLSAVTQPAKGQLPPRANSVTPAAQTRQTYERLPYPGTNPSMAAGKGGSLPSLKWMQALGRPDYSSPERVLVAGCGTGLEAFAIRRQLPKAEIVAVDFSPRSIAIARRLQRSAGAGKPIAFQVADLADSNLGKEIGGGFDLITCHGVLSYIPNPSKVLQNFAAVLRPGGALYLGVNGESHPATRLRPWLASFGLEVDVLREERRLRELLGVWDALHDDGLRELATMSASYLAGDVCGPHFNNWPLARWRAEARRGGWEIAGSWVLPLALHLMTAGERYLPLYPAGIGELAERLDQARPAGFHKLILRRTNSGRSNDSKNRVNEGRLLWTGLYSARFQKTPRSAASTVTLHSSILNLRLNWPLTPRQAAALRTLIATGTISPEWMNQWGRTDTARRTLWLWSALGIVTPSQPQLGGTTTSAEDSQP